MKTWAVKTPPTATGWPPITQTVQADYLLLQNGAAVFKREVRRTYPEIIIVFAPGFWLEIKEDCA